MSTAPLPHYWPQFSEKTPPEVQESVRMLYTTVQQHETAFAALKSQLTAVQTAQKGATATTSATATPTTSSSATTAAVLGTVNNQTGTAYEVQDVDYGGIVTFSNQNPVAVVLNSAVRQYWFAAVENLGAGVVTLTPQQGTVNGFANIGLTTNMGAWLFFDGVNWWAMTVPTQPASIAATPKMYLTAYNSANGQFSEAQPSFSDLQGVADPSQVPSLPESKITGLTADLASKAPTASPVFTGPVTQPTAAVLTSPTTTTSATAGSASALPATPAGYLVMSLGGVNVKVPYFAT